MNLVMVHGAGEGGKDPDALRKEWLSGLRAGFDAAGASFSSIQDVQLPFYGDVISRILEDLADRTASNLRGTAPSRPDLDPLTAEMVVQMAQRAGIEEADAWEGLEPVQRGPHRWEWVHKLLKHLESEIPWLADLVIAEFVAELKGYLGDAEVRQAVDDVVRPAIQSGPCVVVAHSLGTVVSYVVLASTPNLDIPLFVTAGSPLGLESVKRALPRPLRVPADAWLNLTDKEDIAALHEALDEHSFCGGIENIVDIENGDEPHSIVAYLSDARVGTRIAKAIDVVG